MNLSIAKVLNFEIGTSQIYYVQLNRVLVSNDVFQHMKKRIKGTNVICSYSPMHHIICLNNLDDLGLYLDVVSFRFVRRK